MTSWSLSIKTVGKGESSSSTTPSAQGSDATAVKKRAQTSNFTVEVSPDDALSSLHDRIEDVTGLEPVQQRLIYRGRIISRGGEQQEVSAGDDNKQLKIKDVDGLCDGQTVHLVPRPAEASSPNDDDIPPLDESASSTEDSGGLGGEGSGGSLSGSGTASLLAALLGLGGLASSTGGGDPDGDDDQEEAAVSARRGQRQRSLLDASTRVGGGGGSRVSGRTRGRRPNAHRLTAADLEAPDPGSLEPVRQGLLTLHTLLENAEEQTKQETSDLEDRAKPEEDGGKRPSPLDAPRRWYRGQWLDCRDTVNQWLEATVVDVVDPADILPRRSSTQSEPHRRRRQRGGGRGQSRHLPPDPAVGAGDMDGRRRLLLEPTPSSSDHSSEPSDDCSEENDDLELEAGYRERDNNDGVQLLLVHYNGWPHRWDEWMRSDSERIRPFRTRTRHRSSAPYASPTPQSVFQAAPATHVQDEDENIDRAALLPELSRVVSSINDLLKRSLASAGTSYGGASTAAEADDCPTSRSSSEHLPWLANNTDEGPEPQRVVDGDDDQPTDQTQRQSQFPPLNRHKLETLAPLLDRLGRTLTDAAPHVATLAASLPRLDSETAQGEGENDGNLNGAHSNDNTEFQIEGGSSASRLFSLLHSESSSRTNNGNMGGDGVSTAMTPLLSSFPAHGNSDDEREGSVNDPDYVDFVNGMVNVTGRGEAGGRWVARGTEGTGGVRPRGGGGDDGGMNGGSSLASYLAAAGLAGLGSGGGNTTEGEGSGTSIPGLGRLLRLGGGRNVPAGGGGGTGGGGGIDIHIHAIVTGPGMAAAGPGGLGGLGLAMMQQAEPTPAFRTNVNTSSGRGEDTSANESSTVTATTAASLNDHDDDLFSELYSETPPSTDLHSGSALAAIGANLEDTQEGIVSLDDGDDDPLDEDELDDLPPLYDDANSSLNDNGEHNDNNNIPSLMEDGDASLAGAATMASPDSRVDSGSTPPSEQRSVTQARSEAQLFHSARSTTSSIRQSPQGGVVSPRRAASTPDMSASESRGASGRSPFRRMLRRAMGRRDY